MTVNVPENIQTWLWKPANQAAMGGVGAVVRVPLGLASGTPGPRHDRSAPAQEVVAVAWREACTLQRA